MNSDKEAFYQSEIERLNKIIRVLVDRAEQGINSESSDFSLFQTTITLEEKVRSRTVELKRALDHLANTNEELDSSLSQLRETQEKLIQSEKMAALANLVMGIGHELNTPLGVVVTTASFIRDHCKDLDVKVKNNQLTASYLDSFLTDMDESTSLALKSSEKLKELVSHFQTISVASSTSIRESVVLPDLFKDLCKSLAAELGVSDVEFIIKSEPENLSCRVDVSALVQVFSHLINNALLHGLANSANKCIEIDILNLDNTLKISCSDNGVGIQQEHIDQIFNPFFTTARGLGSIGLGLHIVFNMVHEVLRGTVEVYNGELGGACFTVTFPV